MHPDQPSRKHPEDLKIERDYAGRDLNNISGDYARGDINKSGDHVGGNLSKGNNQAGRDLIQVRGDYTKSSSTTVNLWISLVLIGVIAIGAALGLAIQNKWLNINLKTQPQETPSMRQ